MENPIRTAWERLDRIIGPMTISVGFGKFAGDLAGWWFRNQFGRPEHLILGMLTFGMLFILWPILERTYDTHLGRES